MSTITRAGAGTKTTDRSGHRWVIQPKCEHNNGRWYCTTHRLFFDNQLQKDIHTFNAGGYHAMAWHCFQCGTLQVP